MKDDFETRSFGTAKIREEKFPDLLDERGFFLYWFPPLGFPAGRRIDVDSNGILVQFIAHLGTAAPKLEYQEADSMLKTYGVKWFKRCPAGFY